MVDMPVSPAESARQRRVRRSGSRTLWLVLLVLLAVVGGALYYFAQATGGGGVRSSRELIRDTLAGLRAGDVEALMKLADPQSAYERSLDCKTGAPRDEEFDPDKRAAKLRAQVAKLVERTRGLTIDLLDSTEDVAAANTLLKGSGAKMCVAKTTLRFRAFDLKLRVQSGEKKSQQQARLRMLEVDGRFYLVNPPNVMTPGTSIDEMLARLLSLREHACACLDKACGDSVNAEYTKWTEEMAKQAGDRTDFDAEHAKQLTEIEDSYAACLQKLASPAPPPAPAP